MSNEDKKVEDRGDTIISASDDSGETDDQNLKDQDKKSGDADKKDDDDKGGEDKKSDDSDKSADDDAADKKDDKDEEGEGKDKKEEPRIPKSRFDQAVAKARRETEAERERAAALQDKLDAMQGESDVDKIEDKIDKLEEDLEGAIKDGNAEKKLRLRKEIRKLNQEIAETKAAQHAARATAIAIERITYDSLVKETEAAHPELNPEDEGYDQDVVDELNEYKEAFEAKGHGSTESLRKALRAIYGKAPAKSEKEDEDKGDDKGDKKDEAAAAAAAKRKEDAVKKGLDTKGKQPADSKKAGLDSDKAGKKSTVTDVSKLTDKEFEKMDEGELKRARGDML